MRYGNRSGWKRFVRSPFTIIGAAIILVVLARATWSIHEKAVSTAQRLADAKAELIKLQAHGDDLSREVGYLSTDQGVEAELRTKYRAVKNGESVAVIVDDENAAAVAAASSTPAIGWWQRILQGIGL